MLQSNGSPILVAEVDHAQAKRLVRALKNLSCTVRVAYSDEQIIELLRKEVFHEGVVAVELQIAEELALAYLSRLVSIRFLAAVGPADDPDAEVRARCAGAHVYLPRPVTSKMLSGLSCINNRDRVCSSSVDEPLRRSALVDTRFDGLVPAFVREPDGWQAFSKQIFSKYDTGQTSSFFPFSLPGLLNRSVIQPLPQPAVNKGFLDREPRR